MPESTPSFATDQSVGPNDAAYLARAEAAEKQAASANEPAGDFGNATSPSEEQAAPESPAPLAGKFKDAKELEKAYLELQKKLGGEKPSEEQASKAKEDASKVVGPEALDNYVQEYRKDGQLSEASYKALQDMGFGKAVVDAYIEGQRAVAEKQAETVYEKVGGRDSFAKVLEWAATALPAEEQEAFNGLMASGDLKTATFAVKNLAARYEAENRNPSRIEGKPTGAQVGFRSKAEMVAAMSDPKYKTDAAFRQDVARKMAMSQFING